jgi:hypothetical protein
LCSREEGIAPTPTPSRHNRTESEAATSDTVRVLLQRVANLEAGLRPAQLIQSPQILQPDPVVSGSYATTESATDAGIPGADATTCDSATVLEFLAWGRKKDVDFANIPDHDNGPQ